MSKKQPAVVSQVSSAETAILISLLQQVLAKNTAGDVVELGCYKGDTSILFQRELQRTGKNLWLYDSFAGLPEKTREDNSVAGDQFKTGELFVTKREVTEKFKRQSLPLPKIKKAFFEDLDPTSDFPEKICFAFLDGDLYASIKTSLSLVQNKMQPGSVVIIHDYNNPELPGSARAVDEWLKNHHHQIKQFKTQETLAIITIYEKQK
jgi:Macrocin-O-methyltransferase (TylF).